LTFPRWLTFITELDGRSLSEVNGVVTSSAARKPLEPTADVGDIKIGWERDWDLIGVVRNTTFPINLYRTAAKIARNEKYKKNIERKLFFQLTKLFLDYNATTNPATYSRGYRTIYKGEIDLTSVKDVDHKVSFNLIDGGIDQTLKAKKSMVYEIPMDDPDAVWVKMDGVELFDNVHFIVPETSTNGIHLIGAAMTTRDGEAAGFAGFQVLTQQAPSNYTTSDQNLFEVSQDINGMRIKGRISFQTETNKLVGIGLHTQTNRDITLFTPFNATAGVRYDKDFDITFNAAKDEKFFLVGAYPESLFDINYFDSEFAISFSSKYKTTFVRALLPQTVNKRLVKQMTGSENNTSSALIAANNNLALSCINAVRGIPKSVMKTNYSDFTEFCKVQMVAGLGIEDGKIVIEDVEYFLNTNEVEDLGPVAGLEISDDNERVANAFEIGYEEQSYENVNGKFEYNNKHLYETVITKVVRKYPLICPYRADCFGIEILRKDFDGKTTTDSDSDNDVCILDIDLANPQTDADLGTYYNLRRVVYDNWNDPTDFGVPSPQTIFNVELRPEMLLLKHKKWINSMMYGFDGDKLFYRTTEKNTIKTRLGSTVVDGKADYVVTNNRIFIPRSLSFDTDIDAELIARMQINPKRCFRIDADGTTYTGFINRIGVEPDSLKEQPFLLLSTKDNNFLNRVR
jgi:hypothetical protein